MIIRGGKEWKTLDDKIFHNGKQITGAYRGGKMYYPSENKNWPQYIRVTRMPDKTLFMNGEILNFYGIRVTAYDGYDNVYLNSIPFDSLIFDPMISVFDPKEAETKTVVTSENLYPSPNPFTYETSGSFELYPGAKYEWEDVFCTTCGYYGVSSPYYYTVYGIVFASDQNGSYYYRNGQKVELHSTHSYYGKTVYYGGSVGSVMYRSEDPYECLMNVVDDDITNFPDKYNAVVRWVAWSMAFGTTIQQSPQTITVSWKRPQDGKELSTTLEIYSYI